MNVRLHVVLFALLVPMLISSCASVSSMSMPYICSKKELRECSACKAAEQEGECACDKTGVSIPPVTCDTVRNTAGSSGAEHAAQTPPRCTMQEVHQCTKCRIAGATGTCACDANGDRIEPTSCKAAREANAPVKHDKRLDGLVYYLPMRHVEAVFRRELVDLKELTEAEAIAKAANDKAQAELARTASTLKAARTLTEKLRGMGMSLTQDDYIKALTAEVQAGIDHGKASAGAANARGALDAAISARLQAAGAAAQCGFVDNFSFTPQGLVPDANAKYTLKMNHSWFRNDEWSFKTTPQGLLSTVDSVNDDQTANILIALARARAAGGTDQAFEASIYKPSTRRDLNGKTFDPCDYDWKPIVVRQLIDAGKEEDLVTFSAAVNGSASLVGCRQSASGKTCAPKDHIEIEYAILCDNCSHAPRAITTSNGSNGSNGVFYRRELPLNFSVTRRDNINSTNSSLGETETVSTFQLTLPNASPAEHLPLKAGSFVRTHHALEFDQGMLIAVKSERPSEALRIASTPWEIAKATMAVLGEIVQFKVDYTTQDAALIEQQTRLLEQLRLQLEAQRALDNARDADAP